MDMYIDYSLVPGALPYGAQAAAPPPADLWPLESMINVSAVAPAAPATNGSSEVAPQQRQDRWRQAQRQARQYRRAYAANGAAYPLSFNSVLPRFLGRQ